MGLAWPTKPTQQRKKRERREREKEKNNERKGFVKINKRIKQKYLIS